MTCTSVMCARFPQYTFFGSKMVMLRGGKGAASATVFMFCSLARSSRAFVIPFQASHPSASCNIVSSKDCGDASIICGRARSSGSAPMMVRSSFLSGKLARCPRRSVSRALCGGQGFGEKAKPPKPDKRKSAEPNNGESAPVRKAKSLMPLADAASKLLPKQNVDGSVQFNNPGVGDFQVLDSLVEYPGNFELKIIGVDENGFVSDIRGAVAGCLTKGDDNVVSCTTREKGKYTSISLKVFVDNSAQLYKCYEVIDEDKRVKFKF